MFSLDCYFDASYDSPKTMTLVSGWVAAGGQWERFNADWKILLAKYDVPYFHMREFAHSVGPFKGWKGEENKRANFLRLAVDVIRGNVLRGFACLVEHESFDKVNRIYRLSEAVGNPYSLAGRDCIAHANLWLKKEQRGITVRYIFDDGDEGKGELTRVVKKDLQISPIFAASRDGASGDKGLTPLQAADFAAYELLKSFRDLGENAPLHKYRRSIRALAAIDGWWGRYSEKDLLDLCTKVPLKKRSAPSVK